ncbi:hypothetical protein CASFOL_040350 [Castilleja foliolosa]|uniref:Ubiquitin-like protease family profile domain-containing protein n=1 Tax=Castilleja foliolosa TaxID=1961234 RepID=A0ABD3BF72_9LAMI
MASADNNNMSIELYKPSQVGETDAANPTINVDSNPANAADSSTTISDNHNADSTTDHFIAEAVPSLADIITSKPKHKCVQPRLLKRLFLKKSLSLYLDFLINRTSNATRYWNPQSRSLLITHDGSITAEEVRPQKNARTTERPNVDSGDLLTRILEGVRQENELLEQRLMREMHEIAEREARDCGTGMFQYENASYFKEVENPGKCMDIQAFFTTISQSMYHNNIASAIRVEDKGQMEELNPENESVKILLDLVQDKPVELIESWGPLVPITAVDKIYVVWFFAAHFYPLVIDLVKCEVWVIDSMANLTNEDKRLNRYEGTMCLRRMLPALLQLTGFYDKRKDLKPVNREWDLRFADKDQCFLKTDGVSCRPFSCKMMEVLVSRRALPNITEENMKFIRRGIAERIFSFSKPAPKS